MNFMRRTVAVAHHVRPDPLCAERFGSSDLSTRSFAVLGLGRVGGHVLRMLADALATLVASDLDGSRRAFAGAAWTNPQDCLTADVDVLVPAALGGLLTPHTVPKLRCAAIAGPANNQLDTPATADLLHQRGILWAPDIVVSAGGIIHATAVELHHETSAHMSPARPRPTPPAPKPANASRVFTTDSHHQPPIALEYRHMTRQPSS